MYKAICDAYKSYLQITFNVQILNRIISYIERMIYLFDIKFISLIDNETCGELLSLQNHYS